MLDKNLHHEYIRANGKQGVSSLFHDFFSDDEILFLTDYYNWLLGLVKGHIPPISREQKNFKSKYELHIRGKDRPPQNGELWYKELTEVQQAWVKYYYILNFGNRVLHSESNNKRQNIYVSKKKKIDSPIKNHTQERVVKQKVRKCISCGTTALSSERYKCYKCYVPASDKVKLKKGSITSNRMTFNRTKWNDDSYER